MDTILELAKRLDRLSVDYSKKLWSQYTTGDDFGVDAARESLTAVLKDPLNFKIVCNYKDRDLDQRDGRGAELFYNEFKNHHVSARADKIYKELKTLENQLSDLINKHRCEIEGRSVATTEVSKILNEDPDRELRKKAYLSRVPINKKLVDAGFLRLIELRNEYAVACGEEDFVIFRLKEDELNSSVFSTLGEDLKKRKILFSRLEKSIYKTHLKISDPKPWDAGFLRKTINPLNNHKVEIAQFYEPLRRTFLAYGFDISNLNMTFDIFPRKNKSEWGYNFTVEIGKDSRILANADNSFHHYWTLLHEAGHGVHFLGLDPEQRLLNRGVSGIVAEGFANFFGDLSYTKEFLSEFFPENLELALASFQNMNRVARLQSFDSISVSLFDHALYQTPLNSLSDINELYWKIGQEFTDRAPYADEPAWGCLIHHTIAPIYLHNYYMGDVLTEDLKKVFLTKSGKPWDQAPKEFGQLWKTEVLEPSGLYPFLELYKRVCGEELNMGHYLDQALEA